jgi:plastocyanin
MNLEASTIYRRAFGSGMKRQHMAGKRKLLSCGRLLIQWCALLVGLLGVGESFATQNEPTPTAIVRMTDDLTFEPARVIVHAGDTVEWKNTSSMPHTVTADARRAAEGKEVVLPPGAAPFDSKTMSPGGSYRHTFTVPGTYKYICVPHASFGMSGEVIVQHPPAASSHVHTEVPEQPRQQGMEHQKVNATEKPLGWPSGLAGETIRWLGKFHPAAANFPIALIVAAAVAEVLFAASRRPTFDAANRFCLWFGALAAVLTGTLGWFTGGFRTSDPSWVMMTHRWLGTSTDVLAVVTLLVGEASRRPGRQQARRWFRVLLVVVALMVLSAGFFGGALLYGIRHYDWSRIDLPNMPERIDSTSSTKEGYYEPSRSFGIPGSWSSRFDGCCREPGNG